MKFYRHDRDSNPDRCSDNQTCQLHTFPYDIEGIFIEINLRKTKWILYDTYHPPGQDDRYYFGHLGKALDIYSDKYDKYISL